MGLGPSARALWCCLLTGAPRPLPALRHSRLALRMHASRQPGKEGAPPEADALSQLADQLELSTIVSPTNAKVKLMRRLGSRRQRERSGMILLEGHRLVADALEAGFRCVAPLCPLAHVSMAVKSLSGDSTSLCQEPGC